MEKNMFHIHHKKLFAPLLALCVLVACDENESTTSPDGVETKAASEGSQQQARPFSDDNWEAQLGRELERIQRERPDFFRELSELAPAKTRGAFLRFTSPLVEESDAAPLLLKRFLDEKDPLVRSALAEALPRTKGVWKQANFDLFEREKTARVRKLLIANFRFLDADLAHEGIRMALGAPERELRTSALRAALYHPEGKRFVPEYLSALSDDQPAVRAIAARSLGVHIDSKSAGALEKALGDSDAEVRLHALRSLDKVAPERASRSAQLEALTRDEDARVSRLAKAIRDR